jgi:hypothetical protein
MRPTLSRLIAGGVTAKVGAEAGRCVVGVVGGYWLFVAKMKNWDEDYYNMEVQTYIEFL